MKLTVCVPTEVVLEKNNVVRIVAESYEGHFGILPARLDCVAMLVPGILLFETKEDGEIYIAVDKGILMKRGADVQVSVRKAVVAKELGTVRATVEDAIKTLSEGEKKTRAMLAKLESDFLRRMRDFAHRE